MAKSSTMQDIDTGQFCQAFVQSPVGASYGEFAKEYRLAGIEGCVALADSLLGLKASGSERSYPHRKKPSRMRF